MTLGNKNINTFSCLALLLLVVPFSVFGQAKKIKWQVLSGAENEFIFFIPEGFQSTDDGEIYLGKNHYVRVKDMRTVSRCVNGIVLMLEIYEGDVKEIQSLLNEQLQTNPVKQDTAGDYQIKTYLKKYPEYTLEQQYLLNKKRLYVMNAVYRGEQRSDIVDSFFKSARLVSQGKVFAPNFSKDTKKSVITAPLPDIVEENYADTVEEQPDQKPVVLYRPKPSYKMAFGQSNSGTVKLNVMLSASGKVNKTKTITTPNIVVAEGVIPSAEHLVFLPAIKNGKPVTTWKEISYGFQMSIEVH